MGEKTKVAYCPYEKNLDKYCGSCKKGKIEYSFAGKMDDAEGGFYNTWNCPKTFTFDEETIDEYNKNRKKD